MKKILLMLFIASPVLADNAQLMQDYCRVDPVGCRQMLAQMVAQKMGVQAPDPQPQVVYQPVYVPAPQPQPSVYDQIRERQKTTYTNCTDEYNGMSCTTQTH